MDNIQEKMLSLMEKENTIYKFKVVFNDGRKPKTIRCWRESCSIYKMYRGSKTRGLLLFDYHLNNVEKVSLIKSNKIKSASCYRNRFKKAIALLEKSGLWSSFLEPLRWLVTLSDEEIMSYAERANKDSYDLWAEITRSSNKHLKTLGGTLFIQFFHKKCFTTPRYEPYCGISKEYILREMNRVKNGERDSFYNKWRKGYDNTIEFKKDEETGETYGWYSEEYKDCANGWYYLLFDETHAIFLEKD